MFSGEEREFSKEGEGVFEGKGGVGSFLSRGVSFLKKGREFSE